MEDVPLWAQMFNIIAKDTSAETGIQVKKTTLKSLIETHKKVDKRPNPITSHYQLKQSTDNTQLRTHQAPSSMGRPMRPHNIPNIFPVQQRMRNRYDENEHQRYNYN